MPMPGDQHRDNAATTNPFIEQKPHVTPYTAKEIATLQSRLDKQLGPEYISTRPGQGGGKVHYLAAEKVINLANEVFGFNGWSSAIQNVQIDFVDENPQTGKITLGLSTIVRVTLRDGTYHEDIGYGHIENCKGKAAAFEKAKKEAATDAMKRALRNFGNVLGNCLYDKDYLQKVTKVKVAPSRWDADSLHRHPDYAPVKREAIADSAQPHPRSDTNVSAAQRQTSVQSIQSGISFGSLDLDDDFGGNPFDETDMTHPDEVRLEDSLVGANTPAKPGAPDAQRQGLSRVNSMPQIRPPNVHPPAAVNAPQAPQRPQGPQRPTTNLIHAQPAAKTAPPQNGSNQYRPAPAPVQKQNYTSVANSALVVNGDQSGAHGLKQHRQLDGTTHDPSDSEMLDNQPLPAPGQPPPDAPVGFVTGRSAEMLSQPPSMRPPNAAIAFNPHAETPSIRRTHGVNPGKSAPVLRQAVTGAPIIGPQQTSNEGPAQGGPVPQGQPVQGNGLNGTTTPVRTNFVNPSADANRRIGMPPSAAAHSMQNRTAYKAPTPAKRPPLSDVSNLQQTDGAGDAKKPKVDDPGVSDTAAVAQNDPAAAAQSSN